MTMQPDQEIENDFTYLSGLSDEDLLLTEIRSSRLRKAAVIERTRRYEKSIADWIEGVEGGSPADAESRENYLERCSEIVRKGINDHQEYLVQAWQIIRSYADGIADDIPPDNPVIIKYQSYRNLANVLKETHEMKEHERN